MAAHKTSMNNPSATPSASSIHETMQANAGNPVPEVLCVGDLAKRLSGGAHPQDLLGDVVQQCLENTLPHQNSITSRIIFLAKNGAHIATSAPGCAFEQIIIGSGYGNLDLIENIARGLAGRPGELPFHVMAMHVPVLLSYCKLDSPRLQTSLHATDPQGRTVAHYLWDPESSMVAKARAARECEGEDMVKQDLMAKNWHSCVRRAWAAQDTLQSLGVVMDIPDDKGVSAMDLCLQRLNAGDIEWMDFEICNQVQARNSGASMDAGTKLPPDTPPRGALRF